VSLTNAGSGAVALALTSGGTYSGVISGLGGITHDAGTLQLEEANTYTGNTVIRGSGTLKLGSGGSFANSATIVVGDADSTGAVLDLFDKTAFTIAAGQTLKGRGTIRGNDEEGVVLTIDGMLSPGNSPGELAFVDTAVVLSSTANTLMEISGTAPGTQYDVISLTGFGSNLTYGGTMTLDFSQTFTSGTFNLFSFQGFSSGSFATIVATGSYQGTFTANGGGVYTLSAPTPSGNQTLTFTQQVSGDNVNYGQLVIVPEPVMLGLIGICSGAVVLGYRHLRRRRRAA
jgi:autotransporter-associated beta strand protein